MQTNPHLFHTFLWEDGGKDHEMTRVRSIYLRNLTLPHHLLARQPCLIWWWFFLSLWRSDQLLTHQDWKVDWCVRYHLQIWVHQISPPRSRFQLLYFFFFFQQLVVGRLEEEGWDGFGSIQSSTSESQSFGRVNKICYQLHPQSGIMDLWLQGVDSFQVQSQLPSQLQLFYFEVRQIGAQKIKIAVGEWILRQLQERAEWFMDIPSRLLNSLKR